VEFVDHALNRLAVVKVVRLLGFVQRFFQRIDSI
jgi:hypothetical protein